MDLQILFFTVTYTGAGGWLGASEKKKKKLY